MKKKWILLKVLLLYFFFSETNSVINVTEKMKYLKILKQLFY